MVVIRQIRYEGTEESLREQLAASLPDGNPYFNRRIDIKVSTVYTDLPDMPAFVPVVLDDEE